MNCDRATRLISAMLDGELDAHQLRLLRRHLAECPACRMEYNEERLTVRALGDMAPRLPDEGFEQRLMGALHHVPAPRPAAHPWMRRTMLAFGAAACLMLGMILAHRSDEPTEADAGGGVAEWAYASWQDVTETGRAALNSRTIRGFRSVDWDQVPPAQTPLSHTVHPGNQKAPVLVSYIR